MKDPFFSIIIPTYNRAGLIGKTIESVLSQSYNNFEVIIVDDGGNDDSEEVVKAINDERLSYYWKENEERAAARNFGAKIARGLYINFLDSDDLLYNDHLEAAREMIAKHLQPEWFHLGYELQDADGNKLKPVDALPAQSNNRLIEGNCLSCDGVFIRRDIVAQYPFNVDRDLSATEDYELWLRLASRFPLYCDNRITSAIVNHDQRSVVNTDLAKLEKRIQLLEKYLAQDGKFSEYYAGDISNFKANNRVYVALHLALAKERAIALKYLIKALFVSPKVLKNRAFFGTIKRIFI